MNLIERSFAAALLLFLVGCGTAVSDLLNDNTLFAGVAAYKATTEIIERADDPQGRANRILTYTESAMALVDSDLPVTLNTLYIHVHGLVMGNVPDVDRQPVEDILDALRESLAREIDEFVTLTPNTEVGLRHVITRIRMAAQFYA